MPKQTNEKTNTFVTEPKSETMQLIQSINNITNRSDQFAKAVEEFKNLQQLLNDNYHNKLVSQKRELGELEQEYEQQKRQRRITMEQELQEFGLKAAADLFATHGDVIVPKLDHEKLLTKLKELEQDQATKLTSAISLERDNAQKNLTIEKKTLQLEHEKAVATLTSEVEAYKKQLDMAKNELDKAEKRLEAERTLCSKIAESSSQPSIVQHMQQK